VGQWGAPDELLLVQGPLGLNWRRRKLGLVPKIENAEISADAPPTAGDAEGEALALSALGEIQLRKGDMDAALALFERATALAQARGGLVALSAYVNFSGIALNRAGQFESASKRQKVRRKLIERTPGERAKSFR